MFVCKYPDWFTELQRKNVVQLVKLCEVKKLYIKVALEEFDVTTDEQEDLIRLFRHYVQLASDELGTPRVIALGVPET